MLGTATEVRQSVRLAARRATAVELCKSYCDTHLVTLMDRSPLVPRFDLIQGLWALGPLPRLPQH
jgi:hypothetical protein